MTNKRVYELARELGVPTRDILDIANELNYEGLVPLSGLDEERSERIRAVVRPVKKRVYELAREMDAPTRDILAIANELGEAQFVAVSGIDSELAQRIIESWTASQAPVELEAIPSIPLVRDLTDGSPALSLVHSQTEDDQSSVDDKRPTFTRGEGRDIAGLFEDQPARRPDLGDSRTSRIPQLAILAWVLFLPFQFTLGSSRRPLQLAPSDLLLAVAVLTVAPQIRFRNRAWTPWHFALPALFALSIVAGGALSRYSLINKLLGILVLLAAYGMITTFVSTWAGVQRLMRTFVLSVVAVNTLTTVAKVAGIVLPATKCHSPSCIRLTGYFPDANLYGSLLVVALAMLLGTMGSDARLFHRRSATVFSFISLGSGLVLTLSRSSWIGMALVVAILIVLRPGLATRTVVFGGGIVAALLMVVLAERSDSLISVANRRFSIDSRLDIIDDAVAAFLENPFFGIGLGEFAERHNVVVHNTVLWLAAELGVIGLVLFAGLMWFVFRQLRWLYSETTGARQAIVTSLIMAHVAMLGFSIGVEAFYQRHWWLTLSLISVAYAMVHEEKETARIARSGVRKTPAVLADS